MEIPEKNFFFPLKNDIVFRWNTVWFSLVGYDFILLRCHAEKLSSESKNGGDDNNDIIPENMGKLLM